VLWPAAPGAAAGALDPDGAARGVGPDDGAGLESSAVNDASLVLRLSAPDLDVLALGDVEPAAQEQLVRQADLGGVDVVKVAHHGSAHQSRALAEEVGAAVALVGVGAENTYGHPAPATVDLYRDAGGLVLTTDRCGPVAVGGGRGRLEVWASCL
ncbi:MBL fold metallo-hydrolase, partial [Actinotalea ferrariae]|uniref:ComEC/Rec2 family competence protein n=1 Tax=Actinotalea ferrariae TaxID=1386098 RepID=UPI001ED6DC11|nr:MBL fold metallo-hydrolase [Actinotalea ferrariae]